VVPIGFMWLPHRGLDSFHAIAHAVALCDRIASLLNNAAC